MQIAFSITILITRSCLYRALDRRWAMDMNVYESETWWTVVIIMRKKFIYNGPAFIERTTGYFERR